MKATFVFPAAKYADFALAKNANTWSEKHPVNRELLENGDGQPPRVLQQNTKEKWVQLYAASCQTTLKMPFGWFGLDDGSTTYFWKPDDKTRLICAFNSLEGNTKPVGETYFARFKKGAMAEMKKQMPNAKFRQFDLPGAKNGSFGIEAKGVKSESKRDVSFVQIWTPNPRIPEFAYSLSLTSPAGDYAKNLGLIGLILRDRQVQWGR